MPHRLVLKSITPVTHDTHHLVFDRPPGFSFEPGQATELRLDKEGWRDEGRPFTFTSQPEDQTLEFVIKSYPDHDGVTEQIGQMQPGDAVFLGDVFGAITDHGPGIFIAGGAGVTPFIPILSRRHRDGTLDGSSLVYSNKTESDIILRDQWEKMDGLHCVFTVTDQQGAGVHEGKIDRAFLEKVVGQNTGRQFYICGPEELVDDIREALKGLGVDGGNIVTEEGW